MIYNQELHRFVIHGLEYVPDRLKPGEAALESIGKAGTVGFIDDEHEARFDELLAKTGVSKMDCERLPLLYVFSCPYFNETGTKLETIFDFDTKGLLPDNVREMLKKVPETQQKMCLVVLHIYNDFHPDVDTLELFENLDWNNAVAMLNAIKIRFI